MYSVLIPSVYPTEIRNGASGSVRACGILLSSIGPFVTIWFFNYVSVMWCLVALALIYVIRITLCLGLKASTTAPGKENSERDGSLEHENS
jgi:hypothetical protein